MEVFRLVFSPIQVNTWIIADGSGECAVIDCGCYDKNEAAALVSFIDDKKLKPVLLLNTHCHLDHVFGNRFMLDKYGLRSFFHRAEESNRLAAPDHAKLFGLGMKEVPDGQSFLLHNDITGFGKISLRALHVPGHTAGSLAYYSEAEGHVFTGDALFAGSIGRTDLPGGDFNTLISSIRNNLLTLPDSTVVHSGHGQDTTIGQEKRTNPYLT